MIFFSAQDEQICDNLAHVLYMLDIINFEEQDLFRDITCEMKTIFYIAGQPKVRT